MAEGPPTDQMSADSGQRVCRTCGAEVTLAGGSFCTGCGTPLEPATAEPPATEQSDMPE